MSKKDKSSSKNNTEEVPEVVPDEFKKVMTDFINDFTTTFPEYSSKLKDNFVVVSVKTDGDIVAEEILDEARVKVLYEYSKTIYPVRFFDILYKNNEIFKKGNGNAEVNVNFLPDIDFREVWNTPDISSNTRDTIWKYLQLILFSIITNISDRDSFGDTAKLFEAINEEELKSKLEETIKNMQNIFMGGDAGDGKTGEAGASGENPKFGEGIDMKEFEKFAEQLKNFSPEGMGIDMSKFPGFEGFPGFNSNKGGEGGEGGEGEPKASSDNKKQPEMPNPETIHEHISKLLNGKIGALAKEIAEETAKDFDLGIDMENAENMNMSNVFQKLFKNPGKLMNMVKSVGAKLDDKFKKGDIKESEIMKEASDLLSNMKNMPGMGDLSSMLGKMGMGGLGGLGGLAGLAGLGGKGGKINMGALQSHLQQNMKTAKMKERMQTKLQQKKQEQEKQTPPVAVASNAVRPTTAVYTSVSGEQIQQTPRTARPAETVVLDANVTTQQAVQPAETAHEEGSTTQKKKKKKNKNKK